MIAVVNVSPSGIPVHSHWGVVTLLLLIVAGGSVVSSFPYGGVAAPFYPTGA